MGMRIRAVEYYLPPGTLSNNDLSASFPEWSVEKISAKTGIRSRHVASGDEYSSDLAVRAAEKCFAARPELRNDVDYVIVCSQTSDFVLPGIAGIVQDRLGLPTGIGAVDINLGCSGYVYALGLAKGLIESRQATRILLITSDTYTKLLNERDKSVRTIFGDGATASIIDSDARHDGFQIVYGTDGAGAASLIVPGGGIRDGREIQPSADAAARQLDSGQFDLYMDGPDIFNFTLRVVPQSVNDLLERSGLEKDEVDLFVFHQANAFMLDHLRRKLDIPKERFFLSLEETGNTVSSTIPIALAEAVRSGALVPGMMVMLLGFGVGLSWAGMLLKW
ncbi:ketoacyl-ACP synthase III [Microbacterium capsulatum]|uniref:Ketoacyl-ACP synthase III n=1 Tax=Microbacterium capsulatum TaxID=3041921 RepID=A0ABU0XGI1_9MICO|nr:ketoacyl-ACP synthase III [Microbacterium sp. ASV81]MDQ4214240.1 ketoacyl-ACP synthase III [Microbacterium sp. ASV81]